MAAESPAFTIVCTRSPKSFLRRRGKEVGWKRGTGKLGGLTLTQRSLEEGDDIPDDDWNDRVVAVIAADGKLAAADVDAWVDWSEALAESARGAIYEVARDEYSYVWAEDPRPFMFAWTRRRLAAGEIDEIVARMNRLEESDYRMYAEQAAMRIVLLGALAGKKKAKLDDKQVGKLAVALFDHNRFDAKIEKLVKELAKRSGASKELRARSEDIDERKQRERDDNAPFPKKTSQIRALYEGVAAGDESCERRYKRFEYSYAEELRELLVAAVAEGWDADKQTVKLVVDELQMNYLTAAQRARLEELEATGALARTLKQSAIAWRDAAGGRSAEYSMKQYAYYERYRNDDMVRPSDRGMDMAMYRPLNDALFGRSRKLPRLPEDIIVMICDRRFDEARAAYIAALGAKNVDEAMTSAIGYFAPDET